MAHQAEGKFVSDHESTVSLRNQAVAPTRDRGTPGEVAGEASQWLRFLPGLYHEDPFVGDLLRLFESIWAPLDRQLDQIHANFDPRLAPAEYLPWLATWVDLVLDENWPTARQRALIRHAADLYLRRGTVGALRDYLSICTGAVPEIEDQAEPHHFTVTFRLPDPATLNEARVRRLIDEAKPAHTTYTLRVEKR